MKITQWSVAAPVGLYSMTIKSEICSDEIISESGDGASKEGPGSPVGERRAIGAEIIKVAKLNTRAAAKGFMAEGGN